MLLQPDVGGKYSGESHIRGWIAESPLDVQRPDESDGNGYPNNRDSVVLLDTEWRRYNIPRLFFMGGKIKLYLLNCSTTVLHSNPGFDNIKCIFIDHSLSVVHLR